MDYSFLKYYDNKTRSEFLSKELDIDKCNVINKYQLTCNENLYWVKIDSKYPSITYFSHKFVKKSSALAMIFSIYKLCFAKIKYFEKNWDEFEPYKYDWRVGFKKCELYDMEFIRHKHTEIIIDLRNLAQIKKIEDFKKMCAYLENQSNNYNYSKHLF